MWKAWNSPLHANGEYVTVSRLFETYETCTGGIYISKKQKTATKEWSQIRLLTMDMFEC